MKRPYPVNLLSAIRLNEICGTAMDYAMQPFRYSSNTVVGFWIVENVFPATVSLSSISVQKQAFALLCRRPFHLNGVFVRFASLS